MVRIKSPSPSASGGGEEDLESFDLHTPDTLRLVGSNGTPTSGRKRSSTAYNASPSKRANTAASAIAKVSGTARASTASRKKKANQAKSPPKPRVKAPKFIFGFDFGTT